MMKKKPIAILLIVVMLSGCYPKAEMGQFYVDTDTWQFSLAPEVGVRNGATTGVWGLVSARYNNNFESSELDSQSYLTLNVGVMFGR